MTAGESLPESREWSSGVRQQVREQLSKLADDLATITNAGNVADFTPEQVERWLKLQRYFCRLVCTIGC